MTSTIEEDKKITVIGPDHHNTLGIIRSLGECGLFPDGLIVTDKNKSFVSKSKYLHRCLLVSKNEQEVIESLLKKKTIADKKIILIPTDDYSVEIIDKHLEVLSPFYIIPNIDFTEGSIVRLMDKDVMNRVAIEEGFLVPKGASLKVPDDLHLLNEKLENEGFTFPLIVKPLRSVAGNKDAIEIVYSLTELEGFLKMLPPCNVLLQEYLEIEEEYGIQGYAYNGQVYIPGVIRKIRTSSYSRGSTIYARLERDVPSIDKSMIANMVERTRFSGLFDIELFLHKGDLYFIEMNFRNGAYGYAYTRFGSNLAYLWVCACQGLIPKLVNSTKKEEFYLMNEISDFRSIIEKKITWYCWVKQFITADVHLIMNRKDMGPFWFKLFEAGRSFF